MTLDELLNPDVSKVTRSTENLVITIYGRGGLGKTPVATKMEKPFYLAFGKSGLSGLNNVPYKSKYDTVNNPSHYTSGGIECIDAMLAAYGVDAVKNFCKCNAFKYQWRFDKKNGDEDIHKAQWYQNKLMELEKNAG